MTEPWTQARIAREFNVDPKTVEYWRGRDDFPDPVITYKHGRTTIRLWNPTAVRKWHRQYRRERWTRGRRKP